MSDSQTNEQLSNQPFSCHIDGQWWVPALTSLEYIKEIERLRRELNEQMEMREGGINMVLRRQHDAEAKLSEAREQLAEVTAERNRLRATLTAEAEYCYAYAEKYAISDPARAERHKERGCRLMRAALGGG